jgi:hypothetical protein
MGMLDEVQGVPFLDGLAPAIKILLLFGREKSSGLSASALAMLSATMDCGDSTRGESYGMRFSKRLKTE